MAKSDLIELDGVVTDHKGNFYMVEVDVPDPNKKDETMKQVISCHLTGKLRMNYIRVLPGDKVQIRVSPYDLSNGTITYRYRDDKK